MLNRERFARLVPLALAVLLCTGASLWTFYGAAQAAPSQRSFAVPMVLQGHVVAVQKDSVTIRTPNIRPTPEPGKMTPMYIIAGTTFKADISKALFESPLGLPNAQNDLKAGDAVVIVCDPISMAGGIDTSKNPWPVTAHVVEKLQMPVAP
ncbi:MAG TPA: hypothetical protein VFW40_11725 [Capsulimonadaceae bacterium]|nr:hypothetical protein [Capsulimonadaceae bacterium]